MKLSEIDELWNSVADKRPVELLVAMEAEIRCAACGISSLNIVLFHAQACSTMIGKVREEIAGTARSMPLLAEMLAIALLWPTTLPEENA